MNKAILASILIFLMISILSPIAKAQNEETASPLSVNCDIVNSFYWRGIMTSPTVNLQPMLTYSTGNLSIGGWGTTDLSAKYKELDLFVSYSISDFSATVTDYFWTNTKKYFDFKNVSTGHNIEAGISYTNQNLPLTVYVGTMVYGEDKKFFYDKSETDLNKNNFSTYFELNYNIDIKEISLDIFMGGTPYTGLYGNNFAITNIGFKATKELKISDEFSLPMFASFAFNPQTESYFPILGFNF